MRLLANRSLAIVVTAVSITACEVLGLDSEARSAHEQLIRQRQRWMSSGYQSYTYTLRVSCFCLLQVPVTIDVVANEVVSARYADGSGVLSAEALESTPTIDDLFRIIERALADRVDGLNVVYHPTLGYPQSISIDHRFGVADDEVAYDVSGLTALDP
jgi:hypothetical protein